MKKTIVTTIILTALSLVLQSSTKISAEKVIQEKCDCVTVYYSKSGYGKLKEYKKTKRSTTKKGCINAHKQIAKYSGRTDSQVPYSKFCGEIIIKG